jgi:hypothetical protein
MKVVSIFFLLMLMSSFLAGQKSSVRFTDIASRAGIDFKYTFGDQHYENILESSGSGITIFDYNNDGNMDILMLNGTYLKGISDDNGKIYQNSIDRLYRNNGNGTFTDVTMKSGLVDYNWSMAASVIDYDNDGDQDLFLLNYGPNVFYRNNGNGTFTDITDKLGLRGHEKLNGFTKWSIGASFWDYNLDGRLDVMVGNFLAFDPAYISTQTPGMMPHPSEYKGQASILYEQQADGTFKDVTKQNNLYYPDSKCMGLTVFDYDNDNDLDIFQANDHHLNYMFRKDNDTFKEVAVALGVAANTKGIGSGSMHGTIGDVDGDGNIDILVTDLEYGALYRNMGNGLFEDVVETCGVAAHLTGKGAWASAFIDFDNDGDLDIISANGTAEELILQLPVLLENDGKGHFRNTGHQYGSYFNTKRSGRGLATIDFDNDGDRDVIISHVDLIATASLLRNDDGNKNHWIGITLEGKSSIGSAIGAKITVIANGKKQVHINQWSTSYLSNNDPRILIGLGQANMVDQIEVVWNNGKKETFSNITADRYITIREGRSLPNLKP